MSQPKFLEAPRIREANNSGGIVHLLGQFCIFGVDVQDFFQEYLPCFMITKLKFTDIKMRNLLFQHFIIIFIGLLIFYLERWEIADLFWEKLIVIIIAVAKCIYFIEHSFRKIEEASLNNITYNRFLVIILTNILLIVISFGIDFTCLEQIQPGSFKGINTGETLFETAFDFMYLSVVSFTTVAYGDVIPVSKAARSLTILEVCVAYLTTIIIISNFVQIKDSIEKDK